MADSISNVFVGKWSYRSFNNDPDLGKQPDARHRPAHSLARLRRARHPAPVRRGRHGTGWRRGVLVCRKTRLSLSGSCPHGHGLHASAQSQESIDESQ